MIFAKRTRTSESVTTSPAREHIAEQTTQMPQAAKKASKAKRRNQWIAAGLVAFVLGEVAVHTPQVEALATRGKAEAKKYYRNGRKVASGYARRYRSWKGSRSSRYSRYRQSTRRHVVRRPVSKVGRAATILEPPPVRVTATVQPGLTIHNYKRTTRAFPPVLPFAMVGAPVGATVLDGMDKAGRVSVVTDDGRFITVQMNGATNVRQGSALLGQTQVREGLRVQFKGNWDKAGDSYNAAAVTVKGRLSDRDVQSKVSEACRKMMRSRTVEPVQETDANPSITEVPGEAVKTETRASATRPTLPAPAAPPQATVSPQTTLAPANMPQPGPVTTIL